MPWVYLLHFSRPYFHAKHYMGWTKFGNVQKRFEAHCKGRGANLTAHVVAAGITLHLVRVWQGDRNLERKFKRAAHNPRLCPLCNQQAGKRRPCGRRQTGS